MNLRTAREIVARAICQSGTFEIGEGCCAPICMENLGSAREKCSRCYQVHQKLADMICEALAATADAKEANPLDQAYSRINALGGWAGEYDDFGHGVNYAVEQALVIIEELGGRDPAKRGRT